MNGETKRKMRDVPEEWQKKESKETGDGRGRKETMGQGKKAQTERTEELPEIKQRQGIRDAERKEKEKREKTRGKKEERGKEVREESEDEGKGLREREERRENKEERREYREEK